MKKRMATNVAKLGEKAATIPTTASKPVLMKNVGYRPILQDENRGKKTAKYEASIYRCKNLQVDLGNFGGCIGIHGPISYSILLLHIFWGFY